VLGGPGIKVDSFSIEVNGNVVDLGDVGVTTNEASAIAQGNTITHTLPLENADLDGDDDGVKKIKV